MRTFYTIILLSLLFLSTTLPSISDSKLSVYAIQNSSPKIISNIVKGSSTVGMPILSIDKLPEEIYINEIYNGDFNVTLKGGTLENVKAVLKFSSDEIPFETDDVTFSLNLISSTCDIATNTLTCIINLGTISKPGENYIYTVIFRDTDWLGKEFVYEFYLIV